MGELQGRVAPITGRILFCTPLLEELGRPVRTLDGRGIFENRVRE